MVCCFVSYWVIFRSCDGLRLYPPANHLPASGHSVCSKYRTVALVKGLQKVAIPSCHFFSPTTANRSMFVEVMHRKLRVRPQRVCRRSDVLSHWRNNAMKRFQGRIPLVNTFGKASLHPVDGTPAPTHRESLRGSRSCRAAHAVFGVVWPVVQTPAQSARSLHLPAFR